MKIQCPHCKSGFRISDEHLGRNVKCTKCNRAFVVVAIPKEKIHPKRVIHSSKNELEMAELIQALEQVMDKLIVYDNDDITEAKNMLHEIIAKYKRT